jgi:hypothetical protein
VSQIGAGRLAGNLMTDLKGRVAKAMDDARSKISNATSDLVGEINDGATNVERAIHTEMAAVRQEFSEVIGNGPPEVAETAALIETKAEAAKGNGLFPAPGTPAAGG